MRTTSTMSSVLSHRSFSFLLAIFGSLALSGNATFAQRTTSGVFRSHILEVAINEDGDKPGPATPDDTVLLNEHPNASGGQFDVILSPDGSEAITWGQFRQVTGTLDVEELLDGSGTTVSVDLQGLIPNGVYTLWADFYGGPGIGLDPWPAVPLEFVFDHELGIGALGYDTTNAPANPNDFKGNAFTAMADGTATLEAIMPPGPTSWPVPEFGLPVGDFEVSPYVLDDPVSSFALWGAYHVDSNTWGPRPGAGSGGAAIDATWVGHFVGVTGAVIPEPSSSVLAFCCLPALGLLRRKRHNSKS